jgi:hypothetical protein
MSHKASAVFIITVLLILSASAQSNPAQFTRLAVKANAGPALQESSSYIDVTSPLIGAKCDGKYSTDDGPAILSAIRMANNFRSGGIVYFPSTTAGPCNANTAVSQDGVTNVTLMGASFGWPGLAAGRIHLRLNGTSSGQLQLRSCYGCAIQSLYINCSNASMTGTCVSFDAVPGGNLQSNGVKISDSNIVGSTGKTGVLLSLDQSVNTSITNSGFFGAKVAIRGAATRGSFANTVRLDTVQIGQGDTCSITDTMLQNPGSDWTVINPIFEVGNCSPGVKVLSATAGYNSMRGFTMIGGFVADQTGSNPTSTWFIIPSGSTGVNVIGTTIAPVSTNSTVFSIGNNATVHIAPNTFAGSTVIGTFLSVGKNVGLVVDPNIYSTVGTFMKGTPSFGMVTDNTGKTTNYGIWNFSSGLQINGETMSAAPRSLYGVFCPGTKSSTCARAPLDKPITVLRIQAHIQGSAPSGCSALPTISMTDGTNTASVSLANGVADDDSGAINVNMNATNTSVLFTAGTGCSANPTNIQATFITRMQ